MYIPRLFHWILVGVGLGLWACTPTTPPSQERDPPNPNASISPNASILPAPLASTLPVSVPTSSGVQSSPKTSASVRTPSGISSTSEVGKITNPALLTLPSAEPFRADGNLPPDMLSPRDAAGILLVAEWRWNELPGPPKTPELFLEGLLAARRLTSFKWLLAASEAGRLRVVFDTRSFPLPLGTELRARADHLGHMLIFPGGKEYRPAAPGMLRAIFEDRRLDVLPLSPGEIVNRGTAPPRAGRTPQRVEISSPIGTALFDLLPLSEPNQGAALLCRLLIELLAVDPSNPICSPKSLPIRVQFSWRSGSGISFEIHEFSKRMEIPLGDISCPPFGAQFATKILPSQASGVLLTREEAAAIRQRPGEVGPPGPKAPAEGILAYNATDSLQYLLVDGVPMAWVLPGQEVEILGLMKGRYTIQWRSFLGDKIKLAKTMDIPAWIAIGELPLEPPAASSVPPLKPTILP